MLDTPEYHELMHEIEKLVKQRSIDLFDVDAIRRNNGHSATQNLNAVAYESVSKVSSSAQELILNFRQMHGSIAALRDDIKTRMMLTLYPEDMQDLMPRLVSLAMLADTPRLGDLLSAVQDDLDGHVLLDVQKKHQEVMSNVMLKLNEQFAPPLPSQFVLAGGANTYLFFYGASVEKLPSMILGQVASKKLIPGHIKQMLLALEEADTEGVIKGKAPELLKGFKASLIVHPAVPLLEARQALTGSTAISSHECSIRVKRVLSRISSLDATDDEISDAAVAVHQNKHYYDQLLSRELSDFIKDEIRSRETYDADGFDHGDDICKQLAALVKALEMSDSKISMLILESLLGYTLGAASDMSEENPSIGAIVAAQHMFKRRGDIERYIRDDEKASYCVGLFNAMSEFSIGAALQHDEGKVLMHALTQDKKYLNGIKNKSLVDEAFSTDLGL